MEQDAERKTLFKDTSLLKRTLTSVVLVVSICAALFSGAIGFFLLVLLINELGMREYLKLMNLSGLSLQNIYGRITGSLIIFITWLILEKVCSLSVILIFIPLVFILFFIELFRKKTTPFPNIALTILGIVWISLPLSLFLAIGFLPFAARQYHSSIALGYFIILWFGDTGAYFTGKFAGKHKLFHRLSPNKTWEGSIGGFVFALLAAFLDSVFLGWLFLDQWLVLALIINCSGALGDLTKSMLKRSIGVKDSGATLPGHGGILDRFDSLIGSVPFSFFYLFYFV